MKNIAALQLQSEPSYCFLRLALPNLSLATSLLNKQASVGLLAPIRALFIVMAAVLPAFACVCVSGV